MSIIKGTLMLKREMVIKKASRIYTGPEVSGCRPLLVTFEDFKDREEVLRKTAMLKGSNIHVTGICFFLMILSIFYIAPVLSTEQYHLLICVQICRHLSFSHCFYLTEFIWDSIRLLKEPLNF